MGISSAFLETALMDESYVLPPQLGSKIVKWLKDSVHMASPAVLPRTRSSFDNSLCDIPAGKVDSNDSTASVDTVLGESKNDTIVSCNDQTLSGNSFIRQEANGNQCDEKGPARFASTSVSQNNDVQMVASDGVLGNGFEPPDQGSGFEPPDQGNGCMGSATSVQGATNLSSCYYVNPFIEKKLLNIEYGASSQEANSDGFNVIPSNSCATYFSNLSKATMGNERNADAMEYSGKCKQMKLEDLTKTKASRILDLCPQDEVEGEILYLENKLIDVAVAINHHYKYLMFKVASNISKELDFFEGDSNNVMEFLCHILTVLSNKQHPFIWYPSTIGFFNFQVHSK